MLLNINLEDLEALVDGSSKLGRMDLSARKELFGTCLNHLVSYEIREDEASQIQSPIKVGGVLSDGQNRPKDNSGLEMNLVLQFGSSELPKDSFQLYFSQNYRNAKDKGSSWYSIQEVKDNQEIKQVEGVSRGFPLRNMFLRAFIDIGKLDEVFELSKTQSNALVEISTGLKSIFNTYNQTIHLNQDINDIQKARQARQMAAFFANGISYNESRAQDSHYAHLVFEARKWFVLFKLREDSLCEVADNRNIHFCIRYDDFRNKIYSRGRPIII